MRAFAAVVAGLGLAAAGLVTGMVAGAQAPVVHLPAKQVAEAFAQGRPLVETSAYKVHASRREKPGVVEVHVDDTDIVYVLEGGATLVTGGTMVDGKTIGPGEIRGTSIEGGDVRTLSKGDVAIVPNGVPHWFRQVDAPLLYYVVKVTAVSGGSR